MVAFGHYIEHLKTVKPEWASRFLNYGNLKTVISRIRTLQLDDDDAAHADADSDEDAPFVCYNEEDLRLYRGIEPATVDEVRDLFERALRREIEKAGEFHSKLLEHFRQALDTQMQDFWADAGGNSSDRDRDVKDGKSPQSGAMQAPGPNNPKYWHNKQLCETLYQEVSTLKHFSGTHRIAVRKIVKKFNKEVKRIRRPDLQLDNAKMISLYNEKAQDPPAGGYSNILLETIECTYAEFHACEDINDARQQLKRSGRSETLPPLDMFVMGLLIGVMLACFVLVLYLYYMNPDAIALATFWTVLPIYRVMILLNLFMWAWGIDLYCYSTCYLNHTYILGLNPEMQLMWTTMINAAALFTIVNCVNFAAHFILFPTTHVHVSVVVLLGSLLFFCLPINMFCWDTRRSVLRTLWRLLALPFETAYRVVFAPETLVTVQFREFFFADQLISASILLGDVVYVGCFIQTGAWLGSANEEGLTASVQAANTCLALNNSLKPLPISLPYIWRLLQCVIMYRVTWNKVHVLNGIKYAIGIWVLIVGRFFHASYSLWVASTLVGQVYSWLWDFLMDWGWKLFDVKLFLRKAKYAPAKRPHEATPLNQHPPCTPGGPPTHESFKTRRRHIPFIYYAVAIPLDLVLRMLFFTTIDEGISPYLVDPRTLSLLLGITEICRRCMWNVLRIENEQLHNLENYRSKTDEVPEPLNEIFGEEWVNTATDQANKRTRTYSTFDEPRGRVSSLHGLPLVI